MRTLLLLVVTALGVAFMAPGLAQAATLSESGSGTFTAPDRSFVFSGTVTGTPITGTIAGTETNSGPQDPMTGCFASTVDVTLTDSAGDTLTKSETGLLCPVFTVPTFPPGPSTVRFSGSYTITGGTGKFVGATGAGTSTIDFTLGQPFTFTSTEMGAFTLPTSDAAAQLTDLAAAARRTAPGVNGEKLARLAEGARAALTPGVPPNTVCSLLGSFRSAAQAMVTTRQLTQAQVGPLIADAERIRTLLGCR